MKIRPYTRLLIIIHYGNNFVNELVKNIIYFIKKSDAILFDGDIRVIPHENGRAVTLSPSNL
jgi:hypothetical protein